MTMIGLSSFSFCFAWIYSRITFLFYYLYVSSILERKLITIYIYSHEEASKICFCAFTPFFPMTVHTFLPEMRNKKVCGGAKETDTSNFSRHFIWLVFWTELCKYLVKSSKLIRYNKSERRKETGRKLENT